MKNKNVEDGLPIQEPEPLMTEDQLYNDINYYCACHLAKKMLDAELITEAEYKRFLKMSREKFKPFLYELMPDV